MTYEGTFFEWARDAPAPGRACAGHGLQSVESKFVTAQVVYGGNDGEGING